MPPNPFDEPVVEAKEGEGEEPEVSLECMWKQRLMKSAERRALLSNPPIIVESEPEGSIETRIVARADSRARELPSRHSSNAGHAVLSGTVVAKAQCTIAEEVVVVAEVSRVAVEALINQ